MSSDGGGRLLHHHEALGLEGSLGRDWCPTGLLYQADADAVALPLEHPSNPAGQDSADPSPGRLKCPSAAQAHRFAQETQPWSQSQRQLGQAQPSPGPKVPKFPSRGPGKRSGGLPASGKSPGYRGYRAAQVKRVG